MQLPFQTLRSRLLLLLTLAVLPLGMISLSQTRLVLKEAEELARAALMARTITAAGHERAVIQKALGAAQGLAAGLTGAPGVACSAMMAQFVNDNPKYVFAGYVPADGRMTCSSGGEPIDFSDYPSFAAAATRQEQTVEFNPSGASTGLSVVITSHPVFDQGAWAGFVSVSFPHEIARQALVQNDEAEVVLTTVNRRGDVLAASNGLLDAEQFLPMDFEPGDMFERAGTTFDTLSRAGEPRVFAINEMVDDTVVLIGSWPNTAGQSTGGMLSVISPLVFPALMWMAGLAVAYFSVERLVLRHTRKLISAMRRFALGERDGEGLTLKDAPEELRDAERAFNRMAFILSEAEARQEQDVQDKEVLLREVHHRVKNNLQMIASIMNMQARTAHTPEAQYMLAGLQRRVRSLAMMHRSLYTTTEMSTVDSGDLIRSLVSDMSELTIAQQHGLQMETDVASVALYPDQAVPLSMLLAEALTNAIKYAGRTDEGEALVRVALMAEPDGMINVSILNTRGTPLIDAELIESGGVGSSLMRAFVSQLEGHEQVDDTETRYIYSVRFPRKDFDPELEGDSHAA